MTDAAITTDSHPDDPLRVSLRWRVGDTWAAPEPWAVLISGESVDLQTDGWVVRAQARTRDGGVLAGWSSDDSQPGDIALGVATLLVGDQTVSTSTVRLNHSPATSRTWGPFVAEFDCDIARWESTDHDGEPDESYTITSGRVTAIADVSR